MDKNINTGISIYDFNRANMGQFPILETKEEIQCVKENFKKYIEETNSHYYMMLNHENKDFTLFNFRYFTNKKIDTMIDDIIECMDNRGYGIIDVCRDEAGCALEIWVKDKHTEVVFMYLLFPYDNGVIEY